MLLKCAPIQRRHPTYVITAITPTTCSSKTERVPVRDMKKKILVWQAQASSLSRLSHNMQTTSSTNQEGFHLRLCSSDFADKNRPSN